MSAQIEKYGYIENWPNLVVYLKDTTAEEDDWNSDWGNDWEDDENKQKSEIKQVDVNVQNCVIAYSPMGDFIALGNKRKAVFLKNEWDTKSNQTKFTKSFEGIISLEKDEIIQAIICIPLISKKISSPLGSADWTCIVVGFSSGNVRMYTENGNLLVDQLFHNQSVQSFKCRSFQTASSNSLEHDQLEELIIIYQNVIVTLDGFGLFQTLRACRNQIARLQANAENLSSTPPLSYKKWQFDKEEIVSDCESLGLKTPTTFDHFLTASILGGFFARPSNSAPTSNIFISSGKKPYIGFNFAQEGTAQPLLTEIVGAVASKLKSSLFNVASDWLGLKGGNSPANQTKEKKPQQIEPATSLPLRYGIKDPSRKGISILVSPCKKISVVTDSLGRISLIDNDRGIVVRMWKGYRGAECSFIQVEEDRSKSKSKRKCGLFLIIYVPNRGHLEIFPMQQGPRVASLPFAKNGKLLSENFGLMGLNNINVKGGNKSLIQCMLIDSSAQLYTINVPFHLFLCNKANSKLKEMHLLKSLQRKMTDEVFASKEENILEILFEIKTQTMINQALKILLQKCKNNEILKSVCQKYLEKYCDDDEKDLRNIFRIQSLADLYTFLLTSAQKPPLYDESKPSSSENHEKTTLLCLNISEKEIKMLSDMTQNEDKNFNDNSKKSVSFKKAGNFISLNEFFSTFEFDFDNENFITVNTKSELLEDLASLVFCGCLNGTAELSDWKNALKIIGFKPFEILHLCLLFWCQFGLKSSSYTDLMEKLYKILRTLCELEGIEKVLSEFNKFSDWWEKLRKIIAKNQHVFHIYSFSLVARAVAIHIQNEHESSIAKSGETKEKDITEERNETDTEADLVEDAEWENISLDLIRWNILLKQIEDLSSLTKIINQKPALTNPTLPILYQEKEELSVQNLLDKGRGCIGELVGKWLTKIGIDPEFICISDKIPADAPAPLGSPKSKRKSKNKDKNEVCEESVKENDNLEVGVEGLENAKELVTFLKENFSVSLNSSIILCNYAWEYCLEWNKDCNSVEFLEASIKCIRCISSPYLRHGLMILIWDSFILKKFTILSSKSRATRDKMEEKFSGFVNKENKNIFLKLIVEYLDLLMETNIMCEGEVAPKKFAFKNHWSNDCSRASLYEMALMQNFSNYDVIFLHYQLAICTQFVYQFNIRKSDMKPINFFDTLGRSLLFQSLCKQTPYSNIEVDLSIKSIREEFLCTIVSNAIYAISEELSDSPNTNDEYMIVPCSDDVKECEKWIHECLELGKIWGLDLDNLRINEICEFYSYGLDYLGLESIGAVREKRDVLGTKLLVLVGYRIDYLIKKSDNIPELLASTSTNLSQWVNSLNYSRLRSLKFTKDSIKLLAQQIIQLIPESSYDYKLAEEVLIFSAFL